MNTAAKLVITESKSNIPGNVYSETRSEDYGSFQLAAHQFDLAMDYWANRGVVRRDGQQKFTCTISDNQWATVELVRV
jgi:hypothetical protein